MQSLPIFLRLKGRPVILLGTGDGAEAKRRLLKRAGARIVTEEAVAALAIVAIEDEEEALSAIARLKARGILVNAVDRSAHCDFTVPAVIDRDPVLIAIGTSGASAGLAKALRQRLEPILPQSLGTLAKALQDSRPKIVKRWPDPAARRRAIDLALDRFGPLDLLRKFSQVRFGNWLKAPDAVAPSGVKSCFITSDDPDDLTLEQARWLGQADVIYYSAGIAPAILNRARADAVRVAGKRRPGALPAGLIVQLVRAPSG
jgi:uroporphyrin-III C-methyltransferase / precorrin-2 dehydrogenase / sirohydrochlorin ferrochelatase